VDRSVTKGHTTPAMSAGECVNLRESIDVIDATTVRACDVARFYLHHGSLHVRSRYRHTALVTDKLALVTNDFIEAAAAVGYGQLVGDDRQRHGFRKRTGGASTRQEREQSRPRRRSESIGPGSLALCGFPRNGS
jgi:hypothetical protein